MSNCLGHLVLFLVVTDQSIPAGIFIIILAKPNKTDNVKDKFEDTPTNPKAIIMAPSRIPHPAMEMGKLDSKSTGGNKIRQSSIDIFMSNDEAINQILRDKLRCPKIEMPIICRKWRVQRNASFIQEESKTNSLAMNQR